MRDTGTGIPATELSRVFERFHRVESARGRTYEGTGIGLALTVELVRMHGGRISVDSVEGEGTTFTVMIPRGKSHLPEDRIRSGATRVTASKGGNAFIDEASRSLPSEVSGAEPTFATVAELPSPHSSPRRKNARVLVADDNADMRDYLSRLLGSRWNVTVVSNGAQALASMASEIPTSSSPT